MTGARTSTIVKPTPTPVDPVPSGDVDSRERTIGVKVAIIARQLRQRFDERVEAMGVTRAKYMLVATVARHPGATQRMLAQKLEVTDVTAGRLIDRLCADGLLERREHPEDRRAYCVYPTPAAQPMLKLLANTADDFEREMFGGFDDAEIKQLDALLTKLARNLTTARDTAARKIIETEIKVSRGAR